MQHRLPPVVPDFRSCLWPRDRSGEAERNARMVMIYFHPWTLATADADEQSPLLSELRGPHASWAEAQTAWFERGVLHREAQRYVRNYLNVARARPVAPGDAGEPGAEAEDGDEENPDQGAAWADLPNLDLDPDDLTELLGTKVGGRAEKEPDLTRKRKLSGPGNTVGHHENSTAAMSWVEEIWGAPDAGVSEPLHRPRGRPAQVRSVLRLEPERARSVSHLSRPPQRGSTERTCERRLRG